MGLFKKTGISLKISLPFILVTIAMYFALDYYLMPTVENVLLEDVKESLHDISEIPISIIEKTKSKEFVSEEDAINEQNALLIYLSEISYHSKNGIFVIKDNKIISSPNNEYSGKPVEEYKDSEGTAILLKIANELKSDNKDYARYSIAIGDTLKEKMALAHFDKDLNWFIIADYDLDTYNTKRAELHTLLFIFVIGSIVLLNIALVVIGRVSVVNPLKKLKSMAEDITSGKLNIEKEIKGNDELADVQRAFVKVSSTLEEMNQQVQAIVQASKMGKLDYRASSEKLQGAYAEIIDGVNQSVDLYMRPLNLAAEYIDRISKGDLPPKVTDEFRGDFAEIINNLNTCIDAITALITDANTLNHAAEEGNLELRADESMHNGDYRKIIAGMNKTLDNVVEPFELAIDFITKASRGEELHEVTKDYKGIYGNLKNRINRLREVLYKLVFTMMEQSDATLNGRLDVRADLKGLEGEWLNIFGNFNKSLDAVIGPLNLSAEYIDRISKGDIPPKIEEDMKGDFNEIKNNLNMCIDSINKLITDANTLNHAAEEGNLELRADESMHNGDYRKIIAGMNKTLDNVVEPFELAIDFITKASRGEELLEVTKDYKGIYGNLKNRINRLREVLYKLVFTMMEQSDATLNGRLDVRADLKGLEGEWLNIFGNFNKSLDAVIGPLNLSAEYIDRISKGDIPPKIEEDMKGDFNEIKNNLNMCIDSINKLITDANTLNHAAEEGNLELRADESMHNGDYRKIIAGMNKTLDNVVEPFELAIDFITKASRGEELHEVTKDYKGIYGNLKNRINRLREVLYKLVFTMMEQSDATLNGRLDVRADLKGLEGEWLNIFGNFNKSLDAVIGPLNLSAEYIDRISKGDIPPKIEEDMKGDFNEIKNNLNMCIDTLNAMQSSLFETIKQQNSGFVNARCDVNGMSGIYLDLMSGINETLDSVSNPIFEGVEILLDYAKGNLNKEMRNLPGDQVALTHAINGVRANLMTLISEVNTLAESIKNGELDYRAASDKLDGDYKIIIDGMNLAIDNMAEPFEVAIDFIAKASRGEELHEVTKEYKGIYNTLKININTLRTILYKLVITMAEQSEATVNGKLDVRADATGLQGEWINIFGGFNKSLDAIVEPFNLAKDFIANVSRGERLDTIHGDFKGEYFGMIQNINILTDILNKMISDVHQQTNFAVQGELDKRVDVSRYQGSWQVVVGGVNNTLDAIINPLNEYANCISILASGDLTARINKRFNGEFDDFAKNINSLANSLENVIQDVHSVVEAVASSSDQINGESANIASSAQEQSMQTEEVAGAVEEMTRTVAENAKASNRAAQIAEKYGQEALNGGTVVSETVKKMKDIADVVTQSANNIKKLGESSKEIGKIISVINEIADQTNLLALNAAIEAARAGDQGRGFAVVADEVRKLAERTTDATKQIANMIQSIQDETGNAVTIMVQGNSEVNSGIALADKAGEALKSIVSSSEDVMSMINQIAAASEEQSSTTEQIAQNIASISTVAGSTAKQITEIAIYSEKMSKQTEKLISAINRFKIHRNVSSHDFEYEITHDHMDHRDDEEHGRKLLNGN